MERFTKVIAGALAVLLIVMQAASAATLVVGGKNFTEQLILAQMTTDLLRARGFHVEKRDGLGSQILRDAQINGQVDLYWEYTGTSLITYNHVMKRMDAAETYATVKRLDAKRGLTWLKPSKADNTYALAVLKNDKKTADLKTLSDLAKAFNEGRHLTIAVNAEFPRRPDGLVGLEKAYGFKVSRYDLRPMDSGLIYPALKQGVVDVGLVFTTDGRINAFHLRLLKDDKHFFPNYALAPVVRTATLKKYPGLRKPLEALAAKLDNATMRALNAAVEVKRKPVDQVAMAFLKREGLL